MCSPPGMKRDPFLVAGHIVAVAYERDDKGRDQRVQHPEPQCRKRGDERGLKQYVEHDTDADQKQVMEPKSHVDCEGLKKIGNTADHGTPPVDALNDKPDTVFLYHTASNEK